MRTMWHSACLHNSSDDKAPLNDERVIVPEAEANLISSLGEDGLHYPTLDIDIPARLIPSSTEHHTHLYIDVGMSWRKYKMLLRCLSICGIIEKNYARHSIRRGASFVRKPGVRREVPRGGIDLS